jgi:hypothetical protein
MFGTEMRIYFSDKKAAVVVAPPCGHAVAQLNYHFAIRLITVPSW